MHEEEWFSLLSVSQCLRFEDLSGILVSSGSMVQGAANNSVIGFNRRHLFPS